MYKCLARLCALGFGGALLQAAAPEQPGQERPPAVLQIRVAEGEGAVHTAGAVSSRPLTVEITDETGKPVSGATVSFRLPEDGPSGLFSNGLKTDIVVTGAGGQATVWRMRWNRTPGPFHIRIVASKGQARAGMLVAQYLSDAPPPGGTRIAASPPRRPRRWLRVGLVAGAAAGSAALGLAITSRRNSGSGSAAAPAVSVGMPTITIGRP